MIEICAWTPISPPNYDTHMYRKKASRIHRQKTYIPCLRQGRAATQPLIKFCPMVSYAFPCPYCILGTAGLSSRSVTWENDREGSKGSLVSANCARTASALARTSAILNRYARGVRPLPNRLWGNPNQLCCRKIKEINEIHLTDQHGSSIGGTQ